MKITPSKIIRRDKIWGSHAKRNALNERILREFEKKKKNLIAFEPITIRFGRDWTAKEILNGKLKVKKKKRDKKYIPDKNKYKKQ